MTSVARCTVRCTDCLWWDWAIGCAEECDVPDPSLARHCRLFAPSETGGWTTARAPQGLPRLRVVASKP